MLTLIYVISMEFLSLSRRRSIPPRETSPSAKSEEKRLFRSLPGQRNFILRSAPNLQEEFSSCEFYPITNGFTDAVDQTRSRHRKCSLPRRPLGELGNETRAPLKTPAWEATGNVTRTVLIQIELCTRRHTRQGGKWFAPK